MADELARLDAMAQAELVRRREVTPGDLVDAAITRIEKLNPTLNAVITPLFDKARAQANSPNLPTGPFRGVPFLLKDLGCHSAGDPYHEGMRFLREAGWTAESDTYMAAKLRAAGFIFLGKTNTPELGSLPTTEPQAYGPTRNPWDTTRSTGGSSGGSAAAVASGMVPVAHANDGGGSIRIPASECGLVGLKPSRGRLSWGPEYGELWQGLAVEHIVSRSVRDTAAILDVVAGPMPGDPYFAPPPTRPFREEAGAEPGRLRIGVVTHAPGGGIRVHPDCVAAATEAARLLESLGHQVEESYPQALDTAQERWRHMLTLVASSVAAGLAHWSKEVGKPIGPSDVELHNWTFAEIGRSHTAVQYIEAVVWLQADTRRIVQWWEEGFDLLLTPTLAEPPPLLGQFVATPDNPLAAARRAEQIIPFTPAFNITGQPAISLPLYWNTAGLPIGVHLVAAYGREDLLIRVASQLEQARPWANRFPPVYA
ncbi:MAG TPA: amidase [Candidatus Binatia bacterium]|jgi:amidase|nr:amidase [Candidatus Binatia bacterium]